METLSATAMTVVSRAKIEAWLSLAGLEMTSQRCAIIELLVRRDGRPMTVEHILVAFHRHYPRPSREAICHTLYTLRDAEIIKEIVMEGASTQYASNYEANVNLISRELEED